jgi:hypothetical protein
MGIMARNAKGQFLRGHSECGGGAQPGNTHALKFVGAELRQEAYRQFCAHLAKGKSLESWYFEHPDMTLTYKTMQKYMAQFPEEFPAIQLEVAKMKGYQLWEDVVADSATGRNKDANTASLQMLMRNKFRWDKPDTEEIADCAADIILDRIRKDKI